MNERLRGSDNFKAGMQAYFEEVKTEAQPHFVPGEQVQGDRLVGQVFANRTEAQEEFYEKPPTRRRRTRAVPVFPAPGGKK
jgi:hypothetical protein